MAVVVASSAQTAKGRGDSGDVIYAGAAAFETTFVMVHHYNMAGDVRMRHLVTVLLLASIARAQGTITHVIYVIKENRTTDELFGTFPGVQNYCQGGNSPKRCTNNQTISCTALGTHDICGNAGWCEPLMCTTPNGPECSVGDSCPQITTYQSGGGTPLLLQDPLATYPDIGHARRNFVKQFQNGA